MTSTDIHPLYLRCIARNVEGDFIDMFALYSPVPFVAWWYERKAGIERENRKLKIVTKRAGHE